MQCIIHEIIHSVELRAVCHRFTCLGSMFRSGSELLLMNAFSLLVAFIAGSLADDASFDPFAAAAAATQAALGYSIF